MGIQNGIHYPIAIEKMPFFEKYKFENPKTLEYCEKLVSLPIHPFMPETDLNYVIEAINNYE
jgi:dTDP-4-amino-4,6-dideoxygalactose transaminase